MDFFTFKCFNFAADYVTSLALLLVHALKLVYRRSFRQFGLLRTVLQLESWFPRGPKKGGALRPGSQSLTRPISETDIGGEIDDNDLKLYEREIDAMDEKQINAKFEDLLVSKSYFYVNSSQPTLFLV